MLVVKTSISQHFPTVTPFNLFPSCDPLVLSVGLCAWPPLMRCSPLFPWNILDCIWSLVEKCFSKPVVFNQLTVGVDSSRTIVHCPGHSRLDGSAGPGPLRAPTVLCSVVLPIERSLRDSCGCSVWRPGSGTPVMTDWQAQQLG